MTEFDKITKMAIAVIEDYKLAKLFNRDINDFNQYCDGFVINAIPQFTDCRQSLEYIDSERVFVSDLTDLEVFILSRYWIISWWEKETQNAAQIALKLGIKNQFSYNSESQNFKEKQNVIDKLREEVDRKTQDYLLLDLASYDY